MAIVIKPYGVFTVVTLFELLLSGLHGQEKHIHVHSHRNTVFCNFATWARYREGAGYFDAGSFDPQLCTHVSYFYMGLDAIHYNMVSMNAEDGNAEEGGKDGFKKLSNLKQRNPYLKTMVTVGGWDEGSVKYSAMTSTPDNRNAFINSVARFLRKYDLNGIDINWQYPTERGGKPEDRQNFVELLKELRALFEVNGWVLAVSVSASEYLLHHAYDVPQITSLVDFINVMTFDYNGYWGNETGYNSPLYQGSNGNDFKNNVNYTIQSYMKLGAERKKINLGIAFYGRAFTLDDPKLNSTGAPAHGSAPKGKLTQTEGHFSYNEICEMLNSSWTQKVDSAQQVPYAFIDRTWLSYDDVDSIAKKVEYAQSNYLGGVMIWSIDEDDIKGRCHGNPMHLLREINRKLTEGYNSKLDVTPGTFPADRNAVKAPKNGAQIPSANVQAQFIWWIVLFIGVLITIN